MALYPEMGPNTERRALRKLRARKELPTCQLGDVHHRLAAICGLILHIAPRLSLALAAPTPPVNLPLLAVNPVWVCPCGLGYPVVRPPVGPYHCEEKVGEIRVKLPL